MISLAAICDLYNPILLLTCLGISGLHIKHKAFSKAARFVLAAVVVYALMFIDKHYLIWPKLGLDYSTHTATAFAMCLYIASYTKRWSIYAILALSLLAYGQLMVTLNYHSWLDIFSTAGALSPVLWPIIFLSIKAPNKVSNSTENLGCEKG